MMQCSKMAATKWSLVVDWKRRPKDKGLVLVLNTRSRGIINSG